MPIAWLPDTRELHLHNGRISYVMRVHDNGTLGHLHFGAALDPDRSHAHLEPTRFAGFTNRIGDPIPLEYPTTGTGDYRIPALTIEKRRKLYEYFADDLAKLENMLGRDLSMWDPTARS